MNALAQARETLRAAGWTGGAPALVVAGGEQRLYCLEGDGVAASFPISTGAAGFGCVQDSGCTPTGLHHVAACIGEGLPPGAVLKGREFTGLIACGDETEDLITTRILWLEGLEEGCNRGDGVDSRGRYIYIHGTPRRELLGTPASAGCIRMADEDILFLFSRVRPGALVLIMPPELV